MKTRVLHIDADPDVTLITKLCLEETERYVVQEENDPTRAVAAARVFRPNVILSDVMMYPIDGHAVAAALRADPGLSGIPILFLTSLVTRVETPDESSGRGGETYIPKPIRVETLIASIDRAVDSTANR